MEKIVKNLGDGHHVIVIVCGVNGAHGKDEKFYPCVGRTNLLWNIIKGKKKSGLKTATISLDNC